MMSEETKKDVETVENTVETKSESKAKTYSEDEYNALKSQLDKANKTIGSYKEMDIEGIKKSVEDYKKKWEQSENERKAFEHRTKIDAYVKSLGLRDDIYEKYVSDIIIEKDLKFEGDKLIGGDDVVKTFKEKYPNAFKSADTGDFIAPTGKNNVKDDDAFIRSVMGLK